MYLWPLYLGNYARYFYFGGYQINHRIVDTLLSGSDPLHAHFLIFNHFWSLCVEEQFYLFWPMVVFGIRDRVKLRNICIVVVIVALLLRLASLFVLPAALIQADFLYRFTPLRIDALLIGALIALCLRGPEAKRAASLGGPLALVLIIVFTAVECTLAVTHSNLSARVSQPWVSTFGFTLIDCFAGCVLLWLVTSQTRVSSLLASTVPRALGQVSYGFYVFHELLHGVYHDLVELALGPHAKHLEAWTAFIAFFATVCLAKLSFRYFEQPFIRLKFNLTGQISR
jgi:peptidoglycan/LPS O-acetylase OafA/YrhL